MMNLNDFKKEFDKSLSAFLEDKIENLNLKDPKLKDYFLHLKRIAKEGKRIRPYIAYLTYKSYGGKKEQEAISFFVFIELFHLFCLIHDDIIDKSDLRHDTKTLNFHISTGNSDHYGNSQSILLGDMLLSWSVESLSQSDFIDPVKKNYILEILSKMTEEVILGQMIDTSFTVRDRVTAKEIINKNFLKTASYTFIKPMQIGASLITKDYGELVKIGTHLGYAFQMQDDLMDIIHDSDKTNKKVFSDIEQHQHTFLSNYVFENGTEKHEKELVKVFGKKLSEADKENLKSVFVESGAIDFARGEVKKNFKLATDLINNNFKDSRARFLFVEFVDEMSKREN